MKKLIKVESLLFGFLVEVAPRLKWEKNKARHRSLASLPEYRIQRACPESFPGIPPSLGGENSKFTRPRMVLCAENDLN